MFEFSDMDARRVSPECGGESGPSAFNSFASPVVKAEDENLLYAPAVVSIGLLRPVFFSTKWYLAGPKQANRFGWKEGSERPHHQPNQL